jgi:hypothetical protein
MAKAMAAMAQMAAEWAVAQGCVLYSLTLLQFFVVT